VRVLKIEELRGNKTSMNLIFNVCFSVAQLQVKFVPKTWVTTSCARVVDGVQGPLFQSMYFGKPLQRAILWTASLCLPYILLFIGSRLSARRSPQTA